MNVVCGYCKQKLKRNQQQSDAWIRSVALDEAREAERMAAHKLRDELNSYGIGMSLMSEEKYAEIVARYDKARSRVDELEKERG